MGPVLSCPVCSVYLVCLVCPVLSVLVFFVLSQVTAIRKSRGSAASVISLNIPGFIFPSPELVANACKELIDFTAKFATVYSTYIPPPSPVFGQTFFFQVREGQGVYFEVPCGRNLIHPPSIIHPPPWKGVFKGGGGGGVQNLALCLR